MIEVKLLTPVGLNKLSNLPRAIQNDLFQGMQNGALLIERTAKVKYLSGPYPYRLSVDTGLLRQGVWAYAGMSHSPGEFGRIVAVSSRWYGRVHEQKGKFGSKFVIRAKNPRGMTFFWKRRGIWVRGAKKVVIPSRPFLLPAVMDNIDKIKRLLEAMVLKAYRRVASGGNP